MLGSGEQDGRMSRRSERRRRAGRTAGVLVAILAGAGATHFLKPRMYDRIVPDGLPSRTTTLASGVAELAVATGLAIPATRKAAGLAAAGLFVAVFPANVKMARDLLDDPTSDRRMRIASVMRLPLQLPLIGWGLRVWRHG
jgi:uncharacterized membrane protein